MREFKLLKDLPNVKAGTISKYNKDTHHGVFVFSSNDAMYGFQLRDILTNPDWFEEITLPNTVEERLARFCTKAGGFLDFAQQGKTTKELWLNLARALLPHINLENLYSENENL